MVKWVVTIFALGLVLIALLSSVYVADKAAERAQAQAVIAQQQTAQARINEAAKTERFQIFALTLAALATIQTVPGASSPIAPLSGIVLLGVLVWYVWRKDRKP